MIYRAKFLFIMLSIIIFSIRTYAHSGGTDEYGGHTQTSTGMYHMHSRAYPGCSNTISVNRAPISHFIVGSDSWKIMYNSLPYSVNSFSSYQNISFRDKQIRIVSHYNYHPTHYSSRSFSVKYRRR